MSSKSRIFARPQQAYVFFLYIDMVFLSKKWCQFHGDFFGPMGWSCLPSQASRRIFCHRSLEVYLTETVIQMANSLLALPHFFHYMMLY